MVFHCEECGASFPKLSHLKQHQRTENHWIKFDCDVCGKWFTRKDNLDQHKKKHEGLNNVHCNECGKVFSRQYTLNRHKERVHQVGGGQKRPASDTEDDRVTKMLRKEDDPEQFYTLTKVKEEHIRKFKTKASTFKVNFKHLEVTEDMVSTLKKLFQSIFKELTKGSNSNDLVKLTVQSPSLDYPIIIPFDPIPTLTPERFMAEIERVLQSNEDFVIDSGLIFEVTLVDMPGGGARKRCRFVNNNQFILDKRCILQIKNRDNLCCARAIVTAKARLDHHKKWNSIRTGCDIQRQLAEQLHHDAGVILGKCGIEEVKLFQEVLPDYQLHVLSKDHFNAIIYSGPEAEKKIYLYHHDDHFDVITSMSAFLNKSYFCIECQKGYDHKEKHKCNNVCHSCRKIHNENDGTWIHCEECNRFFRGQTCFELHKRNTAKGNSTCRALYRCKDCGKTVNETLDKNHKCGQTYCETCREFFPEDHLCYMMPVEINVQHTISIDEELVDETENAKTFIFFDFECTQDDLLECDTGYKPDLFGKCAHCLKVNCGAYEHVPNLCVAQKVCTVCMETSDEECELCGKREFVFSGDNTLNKFCQWLFSEDNYDSTVMCHNFQGYDSYPILQYLYQNAVIPSVVTNGAKIMSLTVPSCKIKMIDSINFMPLALAKLPEMFGFSEMKKGFFAHLFNTKQNQHVVSDSLPDISYYAPDSMKPEARSQFSIWYEAHKNDQFDFQAELLAYCRSDVDILRRCCLKFRGDFMTITGIDPFERCITIASACNLVFRTNYLQPETIGIIPHHGYKPEQKHSIKALQWLTYLAHSEELNIEHARNGGEKSIGPYRVDGYYETETGEKVVLEFHGDFWHGNPAKFSRTTVNPVNQMTMGDLYDRTLEKKTHLEELGYTYRFIWESDFDQQCQDNPKVRYFVEQQDIVTPLEPRDAFYGGRTEAYTLYKEASADEDIDYYDVTSLYPWVNKTGKIPLGHPSILTENFDSLDNYEGLIKCKVLPPRQLFHPILPCKVNGKLLFHLCQTCSEQKQHKSCAHTDEERAFVGTWVTDEVKKALQKGYEIVHIYEVWHFDHISQYDPHTQTGGLFTGYVNTFMKLKQEASGWPDWCKSDGDKQTYIQHYYEKEGVRLDYSEIKKNTGLRALAKLMLNSFWGKFGQRSNMSQVEFVEDPTIFFDKLTSNQEEVTAVNFVSDDIVEMRWKYKQEFVETNAKTNVVIAAYTTAQARLKLYSHLEHLGYRALYADTDSVIFSTKHGEMKPALGDYLGDLTDEIPNNRIQTFITGGPKNYAYRTQYPDKLGNYTTCKIRGITLNCKNKLNVNFDVVKSMVTERPTASVSVVDAHKITRDRDNAKIVTVAHRKDYRLVFDKRVLRDQYISYPYGF